MADARIQLTSEPLSAATAALERTVRLYDSVARSNERLSKMADREESRRQQVSARAVQAETRRTVQRRARLLTGPRARLETLRALRSEDLSDIQRADLEQKIGQQERAVARGRRVGFSGRLATLISSTRFGAGPVSPLIGRTLDVIAPGLGGALGPIALTAAGVTVAFKALEDVVRTSTQTLAGFRQAAMVSGGTTAQVAGLRAMGLSPQEIEARGAGLRGVAQSGDPFAMMRAMSAGVSILPGELGNVNQAGQYQNALRYLRILGKTRGAEEQLRAARSLQMTEALGLANASERVWREWQMDARAASEIFSPEHQKAAADLSAETDRLATNWENLKTAMGKPLIRPAADAAGWAANAIRSLTDPRAWHMSAQKYQEMIRKEEEQAGKADQQGRDGNKDATEANTDAIRDLISATTGLRRDITGGGARSGTILPAGLSGEELNRNLVRQRFTLGAFK